MIAIGRPPVGCWQTLTGGADTPDPHEWSHMWRGWTAENRAFYSLQHVVDMQAGQSVDMVPIGGDVERGMGLFFIKVRSQRTPTLSTLKAKEHRNLSDWIPGDRNSLQAAICDLHRHDTLCTPRRGSRRTNPATGDTRSHRRRKPWLSTFFLCLHLIPCRCFRKSLH